MSCPAAHAWRWNEVDAWVCTDCRTAIPRSLVELAELDLADAGQRAVVDLNDLASRCADPDQPEQSPFDRPV